MSSKDFVDALARGSNLDAEDALKVQLVQKLQDKLENKRKELAKGFVNNHIPEPEDDKTFNNFIYLHLWRKTNIRNLRNTKS